MKSGLRIWSRVLKVLGGEHRDALPRFRSLATDHEQTWPAPAIESTPYSSSIFIENKSQYPPELIFLITYLNAVVAGQLLSTGSAVLSLKGSDKWSCTFLGGAVV